VLLAGTDGKEADVGGRFDFETARFEGVTRREGSPRERPVSNASSA
jgi:hypothetical protein